MHTQTIDFLFVDLTCLFWDLFQGAAKGSRIALYARAIMQKCLFYHGTFIQRHAILVFIAMGLFCSTCLILPFFTDQYRVQADFVKLWVAGAFSTDCNYLLPFLICLATVIRCHSSLQAREQEQKLLEGVEPATFRVIRRCVGIEPHTDPTEIVNVSRVHCE
jgi:hypothetical protein